MFNIYVTQSETDKKRPELVHSSFDTSYNKNFIDVSELSFGDDGVGDVTITVGERHTLFKRFLKLKNLFCFEIIEKTDERQTIKNRNYIDFCFVGYVTRDTLKYDERGLTRVLTLSPTPVILQRFLVRDDISESHENLIKERNIMIDFTARTNTDLMESLKYNTFSNYVSEIMKITNTKLKIVFSWNDVVGTRTLISFYKTKSDKIKRNQEQYVIDEQMYSRVEISRENSFVNSFRLNDVEYTEAFSKSYNGPLEAIKKDERFSLEESKNTYAKNAVESSMINTSHISVDAFLSKAYGENSFELDLLHVGDGFSVVLNNETYKCILSKVTFNPKTSYKRKLEGVITNGY